MHRMRERERQRERERKTDVYIYIYVYIHVHVYIHMYTDACYAPLNGMPFSRPYVSETTTAGEEDAKYCRKNPEETVDKKLLQCQR